MANFDANAVHALVDAVAGIAMKTGEFRSVNTHEPKAAPGSGLRLGIWAQEITPLPAASGVAATTGYVVLNARAYGGMLAKPEDEIDPRMMAAATTLIGAYSANFTLGGLVRTVDLLGMYGQSLGAQAGYLTIASTVYRVMTVVIPCIVNDLWEQVSD